MRGPTSRCGARRGCKLDGDRFAIKPGAARRAVRAVARGRRRSAPQHPPAAERAADAAAGDRPLSPAADAGRRRSATTGNPQLDSSYIDQLSLGVDAELPRGDLVVGDRRSTTTGGGSASRVRDPAAGRRAAGAEPRRARADVRAAPREAARVRELSREPRPRAQLRASRCSLKRSVGRWFSLLSYTLARSERTDDPRAPRDRLAPVRARPASQPAASPTSRRSSRSGGSARACSS